MRIYISCLLCKIACKLSKLKGSEGSVIGGAIALKFYPKVLSKIKMPRYVIGISGSSGKGSTTELIYRILNENNYKVVYNKNGSNVLTAIATLILNNTKHGKVNADVLLMELDERYMATLLNYIDLTHLVITNITRDQPPRNIYPEFIRDELLKSIKVNTHIIINADDPLVKSLVINHKGKLSTYGLSNTKYSKVTTLNNIDASYCPVCKNKLEYDYRLYGHLGSYHCNKCDFTRGNIDYLANNINIPKYLIKIDNKKVILPSNFMYSVYFVLASYAVCKIIGINSDDIISVINNPKFKTKRLNIYNFDNRKWQMLASKNENNLSYKQSLDFIIHESGIKTVMFGFDNSSRRYIENDLSWIWDIDFEELNDKSIDKIVLIGRFKYDMYTRMLYAGINKNKIILVDDFTNDIINVMKTKTKGNIYSCTCFDKEIELKAIFKKEGISND